MILLDFNQIFLSNIVQHFAKEAKSENPEGISLLRHMILASILAYKGRYSSKYGDIVIACDHAEYWRRDVFPYYKGDRKRKRESSKLDWDFIYSALRTIKDELKEVFPYRVLEVRGAEADDIIACLVKYSQTNDLEQVGLFKEDPQPILIVSSDGDFVQLQKHKNVDQYSPMQKKWIKPKDSIHKYMIEHICTASDDAIPNICSPDSTIAEGVARQKSFKRDRLNDFFEKGIDACASDEERRNYLRNQQLIDFDFIPQDVNDRIIEAYQVEPEKKSYNRIMNYLMKNRMKNMIENIQEF